MLSYFDEESQSILFKGKEAEHMVLSSLGERHKISETVSKYRFTLQHLCVDRQMFRHLQTFTVK